MLGISGLVSFYGISSLALWFLGPAIGLEGYWQVIVIALLLITLPFVLLFSYLIRRRRRKREAAQAQQAETPQASAVKQPAAPTRVYEELHRGAEEAVQWLRSTRLAGKTNDAVYGLPWFVIAGPSGSGKTSLSLSSGLDFYALPSQRRTEINIVRPTRHCEWRMTGAAVLLDTAGRYQNDGPAREEWLAFTDTLKQYRNQRPLDSLVLTVDASEIIRASDTEIEQQAKTLRARLDELMQRMRVRFPVYLLFTHIDSIEGFKEFFSASHPTWRNEVWGATIPLEKSMSAHALFDAEFDHLCESLGRRRLLRLPGLRPPRRQLRIFEFPSNFSNARTKLGLFTSAVFRPNPFSESPMLRGFYFTATLRDRDSAPVTTAGDGEGDERPAQAVGQSFFTQRFFKEVLLSDRDVAASFQNAQKRPSIVPYVLLSLAAVLLFAFTAGMVISFVGNKFLIANALERGARVDEITRADLGKDPAKKEPAAARVEVEAVD
ncbi:MAG: type VI secretion protein IcmF/TssM N-terminal domain-containing protein, partial [Pyrinomonadaceae bacterium]